MIWIVDTPRNDWAGLSKYYHLMYIRKIHAIVNPLLPPPRCPIMTWYQASAFIFCQAFGLMTASQLFLFKIFVKTHEWVTRKGYYPTLKSVEITLQNYKPRSNDEAGYRSRILEKIIPLNLACPEFDCMKGIPLSYFIKNNHNVVWQASDDEDIRSFVVLYHLYYLFNFRVHNKEGKNKDIFVFLDECLNPIRARSIDAGLPLSTKLVTQLRALNVVLVVLTQLPRYLDDAVKANLNVAITFRNLAEQVPATARIQNLSMDMTEMIPNLPVGQGILTVGGDRIKQPVLLDTPLFPHDVTGVTSAELDRISQESVKGLLPPVRKTPVPATTPVTSKRDPNRLNADSELLLNQYEAKPIIIKMLREQLRWPPAKISRCIDAIIKPGIWTEGPALGKFKTYNLTTTGAAYCKKYGIKIITEKSGTPGKNRCHQIGCNSALSMIQDTITEISVRTKGTSFQVDPKTIVEPDALILTSGTKNKRIAFQFAYRNAPQREGEALIRLAIMGSLGPDYVLCVSASTKHKQAISRYINHVNSNIKTKSKSADKTIQATYAQYLTAMSNKIKLITLDELLNGKAELSWMS